VAHRLEQEDEVLGHDVAGSARRVGTAADAALRGVERRDAHVQRSHHVGEALPAGVVKMRAAGLGTQLLDEAREHAADLDRVGIAHRVGQADRVDTGVGEAIGDLEHPVFLDLALHHAAECRCDADLDQGAIRRGSRVAQLADLARLLDRLLAGHAHVAHAVGLGSGHGNGDLVRARGDGALRALHVGHQRQHREPGIRIASRTTSSASPSAAGASGCTKEPTSISFRPAAARAGDPAVLGGGGHGTLDALQAVARPDFAHEDIHGGAPEEFY
jgi:hypothetical protein